MSRRFQFSLRALLGMAALVCLSLGGWHLLEAYGTYVDAEHAVIGERLHIKARYFHPFGPNECWLQLGYWQGDGVCYQYYQAKRSWLCFYEVEDDFDIMNERGRIVIFLASDDPKDEDTLKEKIVDVK